MNLLTEAIIDIQAQKVCLLIKLGPILLTIFHPIRDVVFILPKVAGGIKLITPIQLKCQAIHEPLGLDKVKHTLKHTWFVSNNGEIQLYWCLTTLVLMQTQMTCWAQVQKYLSMLRKRGIRNSLTWSCTMSNLLSVLVIQFTRSWSPTLAGLVTWKDCTSAGGREAILFFLFFCVVGASLRIDHLKSSWWQE